MFSSGQKCSSVGYLFRDLAISCQLGEKALAIQYGMKVSLECAHMVLLERNLLAMSTKRLPPF